MPVPSHRLLSLCTAVLAVSAPAWAQDRSPALPTTLEGPLEPAPTISAPGQTPVAAFVQERDVLNHAGEASTHDPVAPGAGVPSDVLRLRHADGLFLSHQAETLWARGTTYKASADATGFTYIPFFGSQASRNWPIRFSLDEASVGEAPLALRRDRARFDGKTAVLPRGPVEARYLLDERSVEQTFVLHSDAARDGATLRIEIDTDLEIIRDAGGLLLHGPDGDVRFGAATVLDGGGRSAPVALQLDGTTLTYRIPETFTRNATGHLVLDPVITTLTVDSFQADLTAPDVAYDADEDVFCVMYEELFSGPDRDIYYRLLDGTTFAVLDEQYLDNTTLDTHGPCLATIAASGRFVAVYTTVDAFDRPIINMRSRLATAASGFGAEFTIAGFDEFFTRENPDVGGENFESPSASSNAAVVFEERPRGTTPFASGIRARLIDRDGFPAPNYITITPSLTSVDYSSPAISKFSGDPSIHSGWWIATLAGDVGGPRKEVRTTRMSFTGGLEQVNGLAFDEPSSASLIGVDVSSPYVGHFDEVVNIAVERSGVGFGQVALGTRSRSGFGAAPNSQFLTSDQLDVGPLLLKRMPALATLGDRASMTYFELDSAAGNHRILSSSLELPNDVRAGVGERRTQLGTLEQTGPFTSSRAASKLSGGQNSTSQHILHVWQDEGSPAGDKDIFAALVNLSAPSVAASTFCGGGMNSRGDHAFLATFGNSDLTSLKSCLATNLPQFSLGYFLASTSPGSALPPNSQGRLCLGGAIGRYAGSVLNSGAAGRITFEINPTQIASPSGFTAAVAGQRFYFQAWFRDANPTPTSNFTNAVIVQF